MQTDWDIAENLANNLYTLHDTSMTIISLDSVISHMDVNDLID